MIPAKLRVIDIFAVIIWRVAVEETVLPVVVRDKHLKALLLDDDVSNRRDISQICVNRVRTLKG